MKTGDVVGYKAIGTGDVYDAVILKDGIVPGYFDIQIVVPGIDPMTFRAIRADRLTPKATAP